MSNPYSFWTDSLAWLAGPRTEPRPAITNEQPECGFYRMRRGTSWVSVAVWPHAKIEGHLGFKFGGEIVGNNMGTERWPSYAANPITEAEYRRVAEQGLEWSDADPTVAAMQANGATKRPADATNGTPDATKPVADATDEYREQLATAGAGVSVYSKIESDEASTRATSLRNLLNDLASNADKAREAEKASHLKAEREIDARWQPIIKQARELARQIKESRDRWEDDKRAAARQAQQRAAEEQRRIDEQAQHRDISEPPPEPVQVKSNLPLPSVQIRPTHGKAAHVGTKMVVTAIDIPKLMAALIARPEWQSVEDFLHEVAQKLANRGVILDGVTAEERANTR
jgi:hypothetical protein